MPLDLVAPFRIEVCEEVYDVDFDFVARAVADIRFMSVVQGRIMYDHVRETKARQVLELGTGHGVSAAYMAAALPEGGRLITVDFVDSIYDPAPEDVLLRAGVRDRVEIVRRYSTYNWWLREELSRGNNRFDFVYLDGSKNWTIDGFAVVLIEKILRPGGWLCMDDLHWTYENNAEGDVTDGITVRALSPEERREPHLRAVFDLIVAQHPSFSDLRIQDDRWGWARKVVR